MIDLARIRQRACRAARAKLAREVGEMVLGDSIADTERNWAKRHAELYWRAFAYLCALEKTGSREVARQLVGTAELQREIAARVKRSVDDIDAVGARS